MILQLLISFSFDRFSAAAFSCARSLAAGFAAGPNWEALVLRNSSERPRCCRAADKRDELASPHVGPQAQEATLYRLKRVL